MEKLKKLREQILSGSHGFSETHRRIVEWFEKREFPPNDDEVHAFAKTLAIDPHDFEDHIYMILHSLIKKAPGKHKDMPDSSFNPRELSMGQQVEYEHTDCPMLAKEIAKDHLVECPNYYSRLAVMEEKCKGQGDINFDTRGNSY